jgi:hypothetical protein
MSVFKYENFKQWERFPEMTKAVNRLIGAMNDDSFLRDALADLPKHLADEAGSYLLEIALRRMSKKMLYFVTKLGVFERPDVKNSVDVAVMIRDAMFSSAGDVSDSNPLFEIIKQTADLYGEAFAIDSMEAVYNDTFATKRSGASFFADGKQKLETYSANLKLLMRFTPSHILESPALGNVSIKHVGAQISNVGDKKELLAEHLELMGQLNFDDSSSISKVLKDDPLGRSVFMGRQIDAAVRKELPGMKSDFVYNLGFALQARPINTLLTLMNMQAPEISRFISSGGMAQYLTSKWLYAGNADILKDQNFLNLHDLFNQRLLSNPFFNSVFERTESLYKPSFVSVTHAFLSQAIMEKGLAVEMVKTPGGSKSVSSDVLKTFTESLRLIAEYAKLPEVIQAGRDRIEAQLRGNVISLYKSMALDEISGKKLKKPDTVDQDYQFKFMAVRLCAELHQPRGNYTSAQLTKIMPIGSDFANLRDLGLEHKEALLLLVETFDEATLLDALKDYKPGLRPMIELGVLSRKHIGLLPAKDRGELLETAMGI